MPPTPFNKFTFLGKYLLIIAVLMGIDFGFFVSPEDSANRGVALSIAFGAVGFVLLLIGFVVQKIRSR